MAIKIPWLISITLLAPDHEVYFCLVLDASGVDDCNAVITQHISNNMIPGEIPIISTDTVSGLPEFSFFGSSIIFSINWMKPVGTKADLVEELRP